MQPAAPAVSLRGLVWLDGCQMPACLPTYLELPPGWVHLLSSSFSCHRRVACFVSLSSTLCWTNRSRRSWTLTWKLIVYCLLMACFGICFSREVATSLVNLWFPITLSLLQYEKGFCWYIIVWTPKTLLMLQIFFDFSLIFQRNYFETWILFKTVIFLVELTFRYLHHLDNPQLPAWKHIEYFTIANEPDDDLKELAGCIPLWYDKLLLYASQTGR